MSEAVYDELMEYGFRSDALSEREGAESYKMSRTAGRNVRGATREDGVNPL